MKIYKIRINCPYSEVIEVEAGNKEDAIKLAEKEFNCQGAEGEFCEFEK